MIFNYVIFFQYFVIKTIYNHLYILLLQPILPSKLFLVFIQYRNQIRNYLLFRVFSFPDHFSKSVIHSSLFIPNESFFNIFNVIICGSICVFIIHLQSINPKCSPSDMSCSNGIFLTQCNDFWITCKLLCMYIIILVRTKTDSLNKKILLQWSETIKKSSKVILDCLLFNN